MMEKCIWSQISVNEQTGFSFSDDRILDIFQNNNALNETPKNLTPKNKVYNIILCKSQLDSSIPSNKIDSQLIKINRNL